MSKKLLKYEIIGFVFVSILGTLCHFLYEWSGSSIIVGLFCSINESSWEHLKLIFFPYLLWTIVEYLALNKSKSILPSKLIGVVAGCVAIISLFYTYSGIIGKTIDWVNILSFFIGVIIAFVVDYLLIKSNKLATTGWNIIAIIGFVAISLIFFLFTFYPPLIPLFRDPITLSYGI